MYNHYSLSKANSILIEELSNSFIPPVIMEGVWLINKHRKSVKLRVTSKNGEYFDLYSNGRYIAFIDQKELQAILRALRITFGIQKPLSVSMKESNLNLIYKGLPDVIQTDIAYINERRKTAKMRLAFDGRAFGLYTANKMICYGGDEEVNAVVKALAHIWKL